MRVLMWFSVGFAAACAACVYLLKPDCLLLFAVVCLVCMIVMFLCRAKPCRILGVVLIGCAVGFCWTWGFFQLFLQPSADLDGEKLRTEILITDYSAETEYGFVADGQIIRNEKKYKVYIYLNEAESLKPGDKILGEVTLRYTAYGSDADPSIRQTEGVYLQASVSEYELLRTEDSGAGSFPVRLRHQILQLLDTLFPEDTAGFARALLLGDTGKLSYQMDTAFSVSGIRHVIAVSGLHVSILFSLIYVLCWRHRRPATIISIPVMFLFAAVAGFTPSIVRACVMQLLIICADVFLQEYDAPTALSFSALCLLAVNPLIIASVGFQLSVGCMVGILAFSPSIYRYLSGRKWIVEVTGKSIRSKIAKGILASVSISIGVWIVTTPLCALYFGMVSLVSLATNLLTLWMISYIFCMIIVACILGAIWLPAGVAAAWLTAWPIRLIQLLALAISRIPFAAVYTESVYIVLWLLVCYVLIGVFVLLKFRRPLVLLGCMSLCLLLSITASCLEERQDAVKVTVLDVGQGQCVLLKNRDKYYMVDCGSGSAVAAANTASAYLLSKGIYHLDGLILTHYDHDHASGVPLLLSRIPALRLYLPDMEPDSTIRRELENTYSQQIQWVDGTWQIPWAEITMIRTEQANTDNESGICVLFQPENYDILITGDRSTAGEQALMQVYSLPRLDLLIAGHHGSDGATGMALLEQTMPAVVVISVGEDNSFGHPGEELLQRLEMFGCQILRTDRDGTIECKG